MYKLVYGNYPLDFKFKLFTTVYTGPSGGGAEVGSLFYHKLVHFKVTPKL